MKGSLLTDRSLERSATNCPSQGKENHEADSPDHGDLGLHLLFPIGKMDRVSCCVSGSGPSDGPPRHSHPQLSWELHFHFLEGNEMVDERLLMSRQHVLSQEIFP